MKADSSKDPRVNWPRNVIAVLCLLVAASAAPSTARAQLFGPNCQSTAADEIAQTGPLLTEAIAKVREQQNDVTAAYLLVTGVVGQIALDRPITIETRSVEATAIERVNVRTRCRVRAVLALGYTRLGVGIDRGSGAPKLVSRPVEEQFEANFIYDIVFAGPEILDSAFAIEVLRYIGLHAIGRNGSDRTPEVQALIAAGQAEQARAAQEVQRAAERAAQEAERRRTEEQQAHEQVLRLAAREAEIDRQIQHLQTSIAERENQIGRARGEIERLSIRGSAVGSGVDEASDRAYRNRLRIIQEREIERISGTIATDREEIRRLQTIRAALSSQFSALPAPAPPARGPRISGREIDAIRAWAERCWEIPRSAREGNSQAVRIRVSLNQDGTITGRPEVQNPRGDSNFQVLANSAVRAVMRCSAEGGVRLPRERYESWREVVLNFDPREMMR